MKKPVYIRCPRCELNYILKKDRYCNVCKAEMKASGEKGDLDLDFDYDICPICKTNYIGPDEDMCVNCAKEKALENGVANDGEDDWKSYLKDDEYDTVTLETDTLTITDFDDVEPPVETSEEDDTLAGLGIDLDDDFDDDLEIDKALLDEDDDEFADEEAADDDDDDEFDDDDDDLDDIDDDDDLDDEDEE